MKTEAYDHTPISKVSRLEVVSPGARRRWTLDEKRRIVAESYDGSRLATARRNGLSTSQLFTWRRLSREGQLGGDAAPVLVPVEITSTPIPESTVAAQPRPSPARERAKVGLIETELGGWRVTAKMNGVDPLVCLTDILVRIAAHPAHRLDEFLPWNLDLTGGGLCSSCMTNTPTGSISSPNQIRLRPTPDAYDPQPGSKGLQCSMLTNLAGIRLVTAASTIDAPRSWRFLPTTRSENLSEPENLGSEK
ncbi:transposase [Bradyrhizobium manausense]|nr:transposase domain-containing protein [Bradyrhizobium manausense]MBR1092268.1 transposase [Bradyrhizobium manausense]